MQNQFATFQELEAHSLCSVPHVYAKLIAEQIEDGLWVLYLNQITGAKVEFIFGKNFTAEEKLLLNDILPSKIHTSHQIKVNAILNEGSKSVFWSSLFSNMLGRTIKIRNPISDEPRFVKIIMKPVKIAKDIKPFYEFDITLFDETAQHSFHLQQLDKAHDIRALMRGGMSLINQSSFRILNKGDFLTLAKEKPELLFQELQKEQHQLIEVMDQALTLASFSNSPKAEPMPRQTIACSLQDNLNHYLKKIKTKLEFAWHGQSDLQDNLETIELLSQLLIQLTTHAIAQQFPKMFINYRQDSTSYCLDILMPQKIQQFDEVKCDDLEKFCALGGESNFFDNQHFIFSKKLDGITPPSSLNSHEIEEKIQLNPDLKIILLVDDMVISLKFLFHICLQYLIKIKYLEKTSSTISITQSINQANWQDIKFFMHSLDPHLLFICCANADIAIEIIKKFKVTGMITDMEMPGDKNGHDLIVWIKAFEALHRLAPMHLLINTALSTADFEKQHPRLTFMQIPHLCKGSRIPSFFFLKK